jgi:two-component system, OmpR family, KDP operon response regulator KdpE
MHNKILVVDDDLSLTKTLHNLLLSAGHIPVSARTAEDGVAKLITEQPDLILLDVMIPTMGGWEACRRMRDLSDRPIIFLTALDHVDSVVKGLEMGADDYIVKPFEKAELLARIKAHLRRGTTGNTVVELSFGQDALQINLAAREVRLHGELVELTPREYELLVTLARHAGQVVPTGDLVKVAWGMLDPGASDNIKPYIHYLRKKLEADPAAPRWIQTVRGVGYRFNEE